MIMSTSEMDACTLPKVVAKCARPVFSCILYLGYACNRSGKIGKKALHSVASTCIPQEYSFFIDFLCIFAMSSSLGVSHKCILATPSTNSYPLSTFIIIIIFLHTYFFLVITT